MFGDRLRALRQKAGMTQEALARAAGVTNATVYKLEKVEGQDPNWSTVNKLARALGVSVAAFADEGGQPPAPVPQSSDERPEPVPVARGRKRKGGAS